MENPAEKFALGARDKETGLIVHPYLADRKRAHQKKYACIECGRTVNLKKGDIKSAHFAHWATDDDRDCKLYTASAESKRHLQAKHILKEWIERGHEIKIQRACIDCGSIEEHELDTADIAAELEYDLAAHGCERGCRADVALLEKTGARDIICLLEVVATHDTVKQNRPEDVEWYELFAKEINALYELQKGITAGGGGADDCVAATATTEKKEIILECHRFPRCEACREKWHLRQLKSEITAVCDYGEKSESSFFRGTMPDVVHGCLGPFERPNEKAVFHVGLPGDFLRGPRCAECNVTLQGSQKWYCTVTKQSWCDHCGPRVKQTDRTMKSVQWTPFLADEGDY